MEFMGTVNFGICREFWHLLWFFTHAPFLCWNPQISVCKNS